MNVLFVGTLDRRDATFKIICSQFHSLVREFARRGDGFVMRQVKQESDDRVPVDFLVCEALSDYCRENGRLSPSALVLFKEPGVSGQDLLLPHISHTATTSYRLDFYKELLDLVDVVISLGGEFGVLRLLMTCEWVGKPIFLLPGAGGSTDYLWNDFFKKFHQVAVLTTDELLQLKRTPYT